MSRLFLSIRVRGAASIPRVTVSCVPNVKSLPLQLLVIALLAGSVVSTGLAQRTQESPVFKDYKSPDELPRLRHSDHLYQIWQTFLISRKANAGDVLAQHELGIRYFVGVGVEADSAKFWGDCSC